MNLGNELVFKGGQIRLKEVQLYMVPINPFLYLFHLLLESENKEDIEKIIDLSTKKDASIYSGIMSKFNFSNVKKIKNFLLLINTLGIGEMKIKTISTNRVTFVIEKPYLSLRYKNLFEAEPKVPLEIIYCSYMKNFISAMMKKETFYEIQNKKRNNMIVTMTIKNKNIPENKDKYQKVDNLEKNLSHSLKKILLNKHIVIKDGTFCLWNVYGTLVPYLFIIDLLSNFKKNKQEEARKVGHIIGKMAVDFQRDVFGFQNEKIFKQVLEQPNIIGIGNIEIVNKSPFSFKLINNLEYFGNYYYKKEEEILREYFISIIRGMYEFSFNKTTKILVKGDVITFEVVKDERILDSEEIEASKYINPKSLINGKKSK